MNKNDKDSKKVNLESLNSKFKLKSFYSKDRTNLFENGNFIIYDTYPV